MKLIGPALRSVATSPYTYVVGFALIGASGIVAGIAVLSGLGFALIAAGAFCIFAATYIIKGLKPNG